MIMNTVFGGPEILPFDLSKKRISTYYINKDEVDKSTERKKLAQLLVDAIKTIVSHADKSRVKGNLSGEKAKLKEECEEVLLNGNKQDWRRLVDELWRDIPARLLEWKPKAERTWEKGDIERETMRMEAVEICLPSFVPIFVAVENGRMDLWEESVGSLRQLYLMRDQMLSRTGGGKSDVLEIGSHMLYFAGNLGMAIAVGTKQLDFISKWMKLSMPGEQYDESGEKPWAEVKSAHRLWGGWTQDRFEEILKICKSAYLSGFFTDKSQLVKYLFLGNLAQSLHELSLCIKDEKWRKSIEDLDIQTFRSDLMVHPVWVLMKPEEFKAATWELFDSSKSVFNFVFPDATTITLDRFWTWWKNWKKICIGTMGDRPFLSRVANWLTLPGEPMNRH